MNITSFNRCNAGEKTREYGLDLYRIIAMLFITALHVVNMHFGLLKEGSSPLNYYYGWFIEYVAFAGVNCFAMLSGYLMVVSNANSASKCLPKALELWFQCVFFGIGILLFFLFFIPSTHVSRNEVVCCFLPITRGPWWYITSYFGLLFFIPVINVYLQNMSSKMQLKSVLSCFLIFSVFPALLLKQSVFSGGYSTLWLMCCYFFGAYIKLNRERIWILVSQKMAFGIFLLSFLLPYVLFMVACNLIRGKPLILSYLSPFCVAEAVFLLIFCSRIKITQYWIAKPLSVLSSLSLGAYLFQLHPQIWNTYFSTTIVSPKNPVAFLDVVWQVPTAVIVIFSLGCLIDYIRKICFRFLRIPSLCSKMADIFHRIMDYLLTSRYLQRYWS